MIVGAGRFVAAVRRFAWILTPWAAIIVLWYGVARSGLVNPGLVPTPYQVVERFWNLLTRDSLGLDILVSTERVTLGVTLGILFAVISSGPDGTAVTTDRSSLTIGEDAFCAASAS